MVVDSGERFPVGAAGSPVTAVDAVVREGAALFTLGFALVAPIVLGLLLVECVLGVIARNLPQMNVFVLGIPIKVLSGIAALAAWMVAATSPMTRVFDSIYRGWEASLR